MMHLKNNGKRSKVLDGQDRKPAKVVLPGPSLPLDSHPDRIREFLAKWKMTMPAEVGMTGKERPPCWTKGPTFVSAAAQKPPKPRGRKKVKAADETEESKEKPKECKARKPKKIPEPPQVASPEAPVASSSKAKKKKRGGEEDEQPKTECKRPRRTKANQTNESKPGDADKAERTGSDQPEQVDRKAQLSRKSCAYKKARKAALDAGEDKETAAKCGRDVA